MWFVLMLVMLLTNGMSAFGLKIISGWGLPEAIKFPYLTVWYAAGFACIALPMLVKRSRVGTKELGWGGVEYRGPGGDGHGVEPEGAR